MTTYQFAILDPRNNDASRATNDQIFENPNGVFGIEVTVPALAERCMLGNIDPQHTGGDATRAAIEDALVTTLPPEGSTLATVRADSDSVGGIAVISIRARGESLDPAMDRIRLVAESDKFARGGYPGPKPLPSSSNPWPEGSASAESSRPLAAIAAAVADFRVPIADRVALMEQWLLTGEEPEQYRARVESERLDMIKALETGLIKYDTRNNDCVAVVVSTHRAATMVGYAMAPVVVALNPEFRFQGGEPHVKFTICQFQTGFVNLRTALAELNELEHGWGGSPTIGGSPQGVSSELTLDQVVEVIAKHLV